MTKRSLFGGLSALALSALGCQRAAAPASEKLPDRPAERAPGATATVPPSRSDEHCLATVDATTVPFAARAKKGKLVIGVLAGLKDASEENLAHLRALVAGVRAKGAEVLVADGDLGDSSDEQEVLLSVLTQTGLPVLVLPGNREVRSDLDAAEDDLRKHGAVIYDLAHTRLLDLGDALAAGLPGTSDRRQLRAEGGCVYGAKDVDALSSYLGKLPAGAAPVLLIAAVPPKGTDARGLDVSDAQNVGDPRLAALLAARRAPFGIFGQVWESGGRAVDLAGRSILPLTAADQLYLNPGAAEHTPWPMSDGTTSTGQAAVLTIEGKKASFEMVRAPLAQVAPAGHPG